MGDAHGMDPETLPREVRPGMPAGALAAALLTAWTTGTSLLFGGEVLLFLDLPRPPSDYLLSTLTEGALRLQPLGLFLGLLASAVAVVRPLRTRGLLRKTVRFAQLALPVVGLTVPAGVVALLAGGPDRLILGWILVVGGVLAAIAVGLRSRSHRALLSRAAVIVVSLSAPLWLTGLTSLIPFPEAPGVPLASAEGRRVVLLGLDGATWDVMDPLIAAGDMPEVSGLRERGVHGPLRSLEPTLSNRVWTSAVTGVVPERHGITDFFFDRRFIQVPTLWDLVDARDGRVGLFEFLVTDPPLPVNGFVLPGWMAQNPTDTHPPGLTLRLRVLSSLHHPFTTARYLLLRGRRDKRFNAREFAQTRLATSAFLALHRRFDPDLAACVWYGTDRLGHRVWRYFEPDAYTTPLPADGARFQDVLPEYYEAADAELGRVLDELDDGRTTFVVMSDHGMGPMDEVRITGYPRGPRILAALGLTDRLYVESPHSEMFLNAKLEGRNEAWTVSRDDHQWVVEEAADAIRSITRTDTNTPLFEVEIGDMEKVDLKVRVVTARSLSAATPVSVRGSEMPAGEVVQRVEVSGGHRPEGVLLMAGPGVREDRPVRDAVITDVAPTILYALGLPVAEDLDGRPLTEAFTDPWRREHPLRTVDTFGPSATAVPPPEPESPPEELIERLRGLGYIR